MHYTKSHFTNFFLLLNRLIFSRGHATLHLAVSVGRSVGRYVVPSVHHIFEFWAVFVLLLLPNRPRLECRVSGLGFPQLRSHSIYKCGCADKISPSFHLHPIVCPIHYFGLSRFKLLWNVTAVFVRLVFLLFRRPVGSFYDFYSDFCINSS